MQETHCLLISGYRVRCATKLSWQYAAGYFRNFKNNTYETSAEVYYKQMENQIEYREGHTLRWQIRKKNLFFGDGWSYGSRILCSQKHRQNDRMLGYTLSWTYRKSPDLNDGLKYPARYDRRHGIFLPLPPMSSIKNGNSSAVFVYGTGNATTLPERFYLVNGVPTQEFSRINQYRLPAYHRLDFSAT